MGKTEKCQGKPKGAISFIAQAKAVTALIYPGNPAANLFFDLTGFLAWTGLQHDSYCLMATKKCLAVEMDFHSAGTGIPDPAKPPQLPAKVTQTQRNRTLKGITSEFAPLLCRLCRWHPSSLFLTISKAKLQPVLTLPDHLCPYLHRFAAMGFLLTAGQAENGERLPHPDRHQLIDGNPHPHHTGIMNPAQIPYIAAPGSLSAGKRNHPMQGSTGTFSSLFNFRFNVNKHCFVPIIYHKHYFRS
jgi:hypothetical protein